MSYRDDDDPFEEDIVFDQAGLLSTSRKSCKSAIRRVSSGKCAMFSKTLGLCGAFLGLGLTFAIPGPLSPVPPSELSSEMSLMTFELMYRCQGFMIGAMFGARLLDRFNRLFLVFLALLVTALLVTIVPWCSIVWLLRTVMFLLGVLLGFLTTGGNVLCLDLWGRNSGPFMQALHFSFSLGVFLAPFLSQPLMAPVNYSLIAPSTTPVPFPLHRLPRDVGNITLLGATEAGIVPLFPSSHHPSDILANKSWIVNSNLSTALPPLMTLSTKASERTPTVDPTAYQVANSLGSNSTLPTVQAFLNQTSTVSPHSPQAAAPMPSPAGNTSTISDTLSTVVSSTISTNLSEPTRGQQIDVSTTTHRAPRPKPVLVNSEKLQDKKWENEKFRKPPPEDLVPVSTTMKPMVRPDNKTSMAVSMSLTPTHPSLVLGNTSTLIPNNSSTVSNLTNVTSTAAILKGNNSSVLMNSSSSASTTPPSALNSTTLISSTVSSASPTPAVKFSVETNITVAPTPTVPYAIPTKDSTTLQINSSVAPFSSTASSPLASQVPLKTLSDSLIKSTTSKPTTELLRKLKDGKTEKENKTVVTVSPVNTSSTLKDILDHSAEKVELDGLKSGQVTSPSLHTKADIIGYGNHSKVEPSLPVLKDPKSGNGSHDFGKSISLDEQEQLVPNMDDKVQIVTPTSKRIEDSTEKSSTSHESLTPMSTAQPHLFVKHNPVEKTSWVKQKSFGGGHLKTISEAKSVPTSVEDHSIVIAKEPIYSVTRDGAVTASPVFSKNVSQLAENPSYIPPPLSPKRTHHSKPASTVVNDTEVTHTVIDAFANRLEKYGLSRMELMYLTVGMVLLATSLLFLGFLCFNPRDPKSKTEEEEVNGHTTRGGQRRSSSAGQINAPPSRWLRNTLIGLMLLLLMVTSGVQAMYGQLLLVFAIQPPLQLSQSTGSALTATFWGALTGTRFACILLASALSPTAMLVLSVAICSCATWLLSAFASSSEVALWIGSVMVSVGTASVFPSGMLWMQQHVLITHRVAAMLVMGPAMGEMFFPTIAYKMMVSMGPASLIHLPALLSLVAIALWAATWRLARYPRQSLCSNVDESSGYQLANQHDEDDMLDLTMSPLVNGGGAMSRNPLRSSASAHSVHRMSA